ncbi:unnamed protein product [Mesocestoides corti]|uniref:AB hydrolase-1 domain-containing protein n=1 Tax=Mesocestoides corti TaxID=53468 RepID=A0A0R3UNT0_MESCO|nr:unnamed protein product [Mesocestoides corti]
MRARYLRNLMFAITGPALINVPTGFRTPAEPYVTDVFERTFTFGVNMCNACVDLLKWGVLLWLPFAIPNRVARLMNPSYKRWLLAKTIGIRLVYPGCLGLFNSWALEPRMKALESLRATVICCEGNVGFAEIGIVSTPLTAGYSVLAWNHPGFGSSSGLPFPEHELNAMEAVVLFATQYLHFELPDIRLFGWSIGGFPATWAGMHFPNIGGLILDATFDTLDELSKNALPFLRESVPVAVVRRYFDLNNLAQITEYPGPILIMRRSHDEIISTNSTEQILSNRGNNLVVGLLKYRYFLSREYMTASETFPNYFTLSRFRFPHLFNDDTEAVLWKYLAMDRSAQGMSRLGVLIIIVLSLESYLAKHAIVDDMIGPILQREFRKELLDFACTEDEEMLGLVTEVHRSLPFPSHLGESGISDAMKRSILIYLTSKYFVEVKGTHCTSLDSEAFQEPWSEHLILSRSQTVNTDSGATDDENADDVEKEEEGNGWEKVA